jgi:thiol-disulfide isomerase/thioredoxin
MSSSRKTPAGESSRRSPTQAAARRGKSFWTRTRLAIALTATAALLLVAFVTFSRPAKKADPENPVLSAELPALDGGTFRLADYDGKVVVLNFWATWCGPCRSEVPHLVQINSEFRERGVEVVGLSTEDPRTSRGKVESFAREFGMDYKLGFSDRAFATRLMQERTNIPQVFVMRDGRVLSRFIGFNPETSPQKLRTAIEQAHNTK